MSLLLLALLLAPPSAAVIVRLSPPASGGALKTAPAPRLILPQTPKLILPESALIIGGSSGLIVKPERELTAEEASAQALPSREELRTLADSLAPEPGRAGAAAAAAPALNARFDGSAPEAERPDPYFAGPPAPELSAVGAAARRLFARVLPRFYKPHAAKLGYDRGADPSTGHLWTGKAGHRIELAPPRADASGRVQSEFGPGAVVQRKIEQLMLVIHEYAHVIFDEAVRREGQHPVASAYSALTEGFAVTLERLALDRLLDDPLRFGLSAEDAGDLARIRSARDFRLLTVDDQYAEGVLPWRRVYETRGEAGLLELLAALSAHHMSSTPRADPAYQLALGSPELLSAYLGRALGAADRVGLLAYAKAARGEPLDPVMAVAARAALAKTSAEDRRRLFERSLLAERELPGSSPSAAFALVRLLPSAAGELAAFLAETAAQSDGLRRLFGRPGPSPRTELIVRESEKLPWSAAQAAAWLTALSVWVARL